MGYGTGKRVMKFEMCTENDKEGSGWEGSRSEVAEVQNMTKHALRITLVM
jgi:hypothetical protein